MTDRIDRVARDVFGFSELRPGQREAIESVLAGRDTLVVMSTGSGKSAIYQIAGLLIDGATVVVSPLIALQRDQVDDLAGAAQLNSTVPAAERERALAELAENALEFLLLAPEQLANPEVLGELAAAKPSLLVVDEAHSISEWGHDFRPDYLRLGAAAEALGRPTILALTATAAPPVRDEIAERLALRDPKVLVRGFDRPNIRLAVESFHGEQGAERKLRALQEAVEAAPKPGIVYVATRRHSEELATALCDRGVTAAAYHAGMKGGERDIVQERFMDGDLEVVVATTAFGMGIDKADVRWVFHSEVSDSVDAYYQEIGRAGRDGEPAEAVLFYRSEDLGLRRFFAGSGHVEVDEIAQVLDAVRHAGGALTPTALHDQLDLSETKLTTALARLEEAGAVRVLPDGEIVPRDVSADAVRAAAETEEKRRVFDRSRVDMMRGYAETDDCRRAFILSYFGEPFEPPCGRCDNCEEGRTDAPPEDVPFAVGSRVAHAQWGGGVVQRYDDDAVVVLFDEVGYKTLALEVIRDRGILERA
ncbi:MAG TPA: ATP-dependent DNA helicase RecQ [Solirubrobacteraceae bacterium]|nr:ATP-dependent DNA helicase RecQ [Solirubrobacteraceae bacterium]